jgi:hypothetical protein
MSVYVLLIHSHKIPHTLSRFTALMCTYCDAHGDTTPVCNTHSMLKAHRQKHRATYEESNKYDFYFMVMHRPIVCVCVCAIYCFFVERMYVYVCVQVCVCMGV